MSTPFDSIEGAQEYLALLREAVEEAKQTAGSDIATEAKAKSSRRLDALRLVWFKLEKLDLHVKASYRLLNDLRTLRRLLLEERSGSATGLQKQLASEREIAHQEVAPTGTD
jgi:hypothetical protein